MFNITDGNNNVSRDKPVEHIDMVIGLHVSACTSCTRTMRVRRDIAIDITESVQLLVRFNALRSMPVMPKLEHYNVDALRSMAAAALATQAAAANARARPRLAGQCEKWLARPNTQMPYLHWAAPTPSSCPYMRPHNCPHVLDGLVAGDVVVAVGDVEHGHCTCWSMLETSVRRPCAGWCTRMMIGAP